MDSEKLLLTAAILGTDKQAPGRLPVSGCLAESFAELNKLLPGLGSERTLLHAFALISLSEKAGRCLKKFESEFCLPSGPEEMPAASAGHLRSLLETRPELLEEWLHLVAQAHKRVPDDCLVDILQKAQENKFLESLTAACVGTRGRWLAQLNDDWKFVESETCADNADLGSLKELFETGSFLERAQAFAQLRLLDPSCARELVLSTWKSDGVEARASFVAIFSVNLSMADENFLETEALDDKRKEVRQEARERLFSLSESRLVKRAEQRAFACLSLENEKSGLYNNLLAGRGNKIKLHVVPPAECTPDMQRDGIVARPAEARLAERAWWLSQIIAQVRPGRLAQHLHISVSQLVEAVAGSSWQVAFRLGLEQSAIRYKECQLAFQLLLEDIGEYAYALFHLLDSSSQEAVLSRALEKRGFMVAQKPQDREIALLLQMKHQWSAAFSRVVLMTLRTHLRERNNYFFMDNILKHVSCHLDTDLWASVQDTWASSCQEPALARMTATLSFRREMKNALMSESQKVTLRHRQD